MAPAVRIAPGGLVSRHPVAGEHGQETAAEIGPAAALTVERWLGIPMPSRLARTSERLTLLWCFLATARSDIVAISARILRSHLATRSGGRASLRRSFATAAAVVPTNSARLRSLTTPIRARRFGVHFAVENFGIPSSALFRCTRGLLTFIASAMVPSGTVPSLAIILGDQRIRRRGHAGIPLQPVLDQPLCRR